MIVKIYDVDGNVDCFESQNFQICPKKIMNKRILKAIIYSSNGKKLAKVSRHFKWFYKKFVYVPDPIPANSTPVTAAPVATPVEPKPDATPVSESTPKKNVNSRPRNKAAKPQA